MNSKVKMLHFILFKLSRKMVLSEIWVCREDQERYSCSCDIKYTKMTELSPSFRPLFATRNPISRNPNTFKSLSSPHTVSHAQSLEGTRPQSSRSLFGIIAAPSTSFLLIEIAVASFVAREGIFLQICNLE